MSTKIVLNSKKVQKAGQRIWFLELSHDLHRYKQIILY